MTSACTVFVRIRPLEGLLESCRRILLEKLPEIRKIEGCEEYSLFVATDGDLVIHERWSSREAWQNHFDTQPIRNLKEQLTPLVQLPVERLESYSAE